MAYQWVYTRHQPATAISECVRKLSIITDLKQCVNGHWLLLLSWKQWNWITSHKWSSVPNYTRCIVYCMCVAWNFNLNLPTFTVSPDPVQNLQATNTTNTTITISWVLGFDGWEPIDNITVSYAALWNNVSASEGSITLQGAVITHTLVDLQPLTTYNITVVTVNDIGPSNPSTIISVETKPISECMHKGL